MIGPIALVVIAFCLAGGAAWMMTLARGTERAEEVRQRIRTSPAAEDTELPTAQNRKLQNPLVRRVVQLFWRAGAEISTSQALLVLLVPILIVVLMCAIAGLLWGSLIGGALIGFAYLVVLRFATRRRLRIIDQLPAFLESVIRVLAAGNSLEESFGAAARESAEPIKPLFESVVRQTKLGAPIDEVLAEMGVIYRLRDLRVLGLASNVNRRYGGSIRAVLKSLIVAIRQRTMSARELRALTSETRFSALVLAIVPISLSIYIYARNPQYYATMYRDPTGKFLLITCILMQVIGAFVLWRMLNSTSDEET